MDKKDLNLKNKNQKLNNSFRKYLFQIHCKKKKKREGDRLCLHFTEGGVLQTV